MRRPLVALAAVLSAVLLSPTLAVASANDGGEKRGPDAEHAADRALAVAQRVLNGDAAASDPSPSMALRDLALSQDRLSPEERRRSATLLARPTDGAGDPQGDGYTVPSRKKCSDVVCVHWVPTTTDAPPSTAWVDKNLSVMTQAYQQETGTLGYRRPLADGTRGGNSKFDFYLKDIGDQGLYGYCVPESERQQYLYSAYCVVDDDFAKAQYPSNTPLGNLRVTTAHEFFHAVQYAYDATEDQWLLESTATWMEERFADAVNDNRSYLQFGQLTKPATPLDTFAPYGYTHYGNWIFFEFLSNRYGARVVRWIWEQAGAYAGAPDHYSTEAIRAVLKSRGGFANNYGSFAAGNSTPARIYPEGDAYAPAPNNRTSTLSFGTRSTGDQTFSVDHLSSRRIQIRPDATLTNRAWDLRVELNGPHLARSPQYLVTVVTTSGAVSTLRPKLDTAGRGSLLVPGFNANRVDRVIVTAANASLRTRCWTGTYFACQGTPTDDKLSFLVRGTLTR